MAVIRRSKAQFRVLFDPVQVEILGEDRFKWVPAGVELVAPEDRAPSIAATVRDTLPPGYQVFIRQVDRELNRIGVIKATRPFQCVRMFLTLAAAEMSLRRKHPVVDWLVRWNRRAKFQVVIVGSEDLWVAISDDAPVARDQAQLEEMIIAAGEICRPLRHRPEDWKAFCSFARDRHILAFRWDPLVMLELAGFKV